MERDNESGTQDRCTESGETQTDSQSRREFVKGLTKWSMVLVGAVLGERAIGVGQLDKGSNKGHGFGQLAAFHQNQHFNRPATTYNDKHWNVHVNKVHGP
jgi:hypothetical protein